MNKDQAPDHFDMVASSGISHSSINTFGSMPVSLFRANLPTLTLETALWALVLAFALAWRWFVLTGSPLNAEEGAIAYSAWQLQHGQMPLDWREPLTVVFCTVSFLFFGSSDFVSRLTPILAGSVVPLLLYWTRSLFGRSAALGAALLVALSPSFVFFSRFLSGDMLAVSITVTLLILFSRVGGRPSRRQLFGIAVLIALLLNSGPTGWTLVIAASFALAGLFAVGRLPAAWHCPIRSVVDNRTESWRFLAVFAFTFLLLGNLFRPWYSLANALGLAGWLAQFGLNQGTRPAYALQTMVSYEPLLLLAGLASGLFLLRWKRLRLSSDDVSLRLFLLFWSLFAVFVFLLSNREHAGSILAALLPLGLLGGDFVARLFSSVRGLRWRNVLLTLASASVILVYLWIVTAQTAAGTLTPAWVFVPIALLAAGVIALAIFAAIRLDGAKSLFAFGIFAAIILGAYAVHTVAWVSRSGPTELTVKNVASPAVRSLAEKLTSNVEKSGAPGSEAIVVADDLRPSLAWYLRDLPELAYIGEVRPGPRTLLAQDLQVVGWQGYDQYRIRVADAWHPEGPTWTGLWRWLVYRESYGKVDSDYAVILLKKD